MNFCTKFIIVLREGIIEDITPVKAALTRQNANLLFGRIGIQLVTQLGSVLKHIVFSQHTLLHLIKHSHRFLITLCLDQLFYRLDSLLRPADIYWFKSLSVKVISQVGATVVDRECSRQITIADFLCPIKGLGRILDSDMIFVWIKYIPLVIKRTEASPKDIYLVSEMRFQLLYELDTVQMATGKSFVTRNDRDKLCLLYSRRLAQRVVVL